MNTDRDTTRLVRSWMRTDEHESADRVLDAVLDRLDATPQRRATWWSARRFSAMNATAKLALGVAAAALVAVVGFSLVMGQNVGGPPGTEAGTEAPATASPSPKANTYVITNEEGVRVTLTLPERGWMRSGWLVNNLGNVDSDLTAIQVWAVGQTYTDPCQWKGTELDPPLGPTVDDLATALENQRAREATTSDVTLDGYSGKLVKMTVPADARFSECDDGEFRSWVGPGGPDDVRHHQGPGQHDDVYIVDVDGTRLVIDAVYYPDSSAADRAELRRMLDTIQIEPPE